jgi:DNA-binding NarL/FixJ family response regulator
MVAIAIFSGDPLLRRNLEKLLHGDPTITIVGAVDDPAAVLRLIDENHVDAVLVDQPSRDQLADWRSRHGEIVFVVLVDGSDGEDSLDSLLAGALAVLFRSAGRQEIVVAITAATNGLAVLPREFLATLLNGASLTEERRDGNVSAGAGLTPRELEVLAAMEDGASNKAIARRLGISFHTAKFHVAAILAKLNADSRTEAVTRAAQLGLVML